MFSALRLQPDRVATLSDLPSLLRRRLIQASGAFFLVHEVALAQLSGVAPAKAERLALSTFLDVLLPRDAHSGSATDLRVDQALWAFSRDDARFRQLLVQGSRWLNMTGGAGFADLTAAQQVQVVQWMSTADWNELPRRFYELVRQTAVETYYSDPRAWTGTGLQRPPQPVGYPPPWQ